MTLDEKRIPATLVNNALLAVIIAATFYVCFGLWANGDAVRALMVHILSSIAMVTVMKRNALGR